MIYGFDTDDEDHASACLIVYAAWRSRDKGRFKITPEVWSQVTGFVRAAAMTSKTLGQFADRLCKRMLAGSLSPKWLEIGHKGEIPLAPVVGDDGKLSHAIQFAPDPDMREFATSVFARAPRPAIDFARKETVYLIALVRDRLEREKPIESKVEEIDE